MLSARSVNHLRGYFSRAFTMARRMEKFPRPNPVADVPKRKVREAAAGLPAAARGAAAARVAQAEVEAAVRDGALHGHAQGRAVRAAEGGRRLRRGADHRSAGRTTATSRRAAGSRRSRSTASWCPTCKRAIAASPSELVFPDDGREDAAEAHGARARAPAGDAPGGHRHGLRPQVPAQGLRPPGAGRRTRTRAAARSATSSSSRSGEVRKIRFHHLRHTTASLLLMNGRRPGGGAADHAPPGPAHHDRGLRPPGAGLPQEGDRAPQLRPARRRTERADVAATARPAGTAEPRSRRAAPRSRRCPPTRALTRAQRLRLLPGYYPTPERAACTVDAPRSRWKGSART